MNNSHFGISRFGLVVRWFSVGAISFFVSYLGMFLGKAPPYAAIIWPVNGMLIAVIVLSPQRYWPGYLMVSWVASILSHITYGIPLVLSSLFATANVVEILIAISLLTEGDIVRLDLTRRKTLLRFLFFGVLLAPLGSTLFVQLGRLIYGSPSGRLELLNWYCGDALGIAMMTPMILAIHIDELKKLFSKEKALETILLLVGLTLLSLIIFHQGSYPIAFLLYPALLLVIFRIRSSGAAIGVFLLAVPAVYFTSESMGPFSRSQRGLYIDGVFILQCYLIVLLVTVYTVSATLSQRDRLQNEIYDAYLRAQINPHFLFNALNGIADLATESPAKAEEMTLRLSAVFRYVLVSTERSRSSLAEELEFAKSYLGIEEARFGDRLKVHIEVEPALMKEIIPTLLLQPLIENALKHGLLSKRDGGTLGISAYRTASGFSVVVSDDGLGIHSTPNRSHNQGTGVGLQNVRERLQVAYKGYATLTLADREGGGTDAVITIQKALSA